MNSSPPSPVINWQSINPTEAADRSDIDQQEADGLPPLFTPAMRTVIESPQGQSVEIASPPSRPGIPTSSIVTVLLPLVGLVLLAVISLFVMRSGNSIFLLMSAPLMLVSVVGGILGFFNERKKYRKLVVDREKLYGAHLADCSRQLEALRQQQLKANLTPHPDLPGCLEQARLADPERRLWERSPLDPDFLDLRLGVGTYPAAYQIKFSLSANDKMDQDALVRRARELVKEYSTIESAAVTLPLNALGIVGITGSRAEIQQAGRALIIQLAAHHLPTEVKLVLIFPEAEREQWAWARWLPHLWSEDGSCRLIAANPRDAAVLLSDLSTLFNRRQLALHKNERSDEKMRFEPHYVFFFADPAVIDEANDSSYNKLFAILMSEGQDLGTSTILCQGARQKLDRACRAVIKLKEPPSLYISSPKPETIPFTPDDIHTEGAEAFARSLAPLRLKTRARDQAKGSRLAEFVSLFDLLHISQPDDLQLASTWVRKSPLVPLVAPIGLQVEGLTYVNLQEGAVNGFGPHAVVGGMTGTGKTKGLLHTLILSLAIHNHPYDLNFLLIDYKGGDLYDELKELPHVVGYLGNLASTRKQSALVRRLFTCLEAELKRRRNLLGSASINSFHEEQRSQGKNPDILLPHLIVVIDEFAELISKNPPDVIEFLRSSLVSVARTGRSLGVHLVLATQDPGNVVRGDIRDAINLILCLGMGTREASNELVETEDAYIENLGKHMGRAYFKAKRENQYTQFQVAFSGAPVELSLAEGVPEEKKIHEVSLSGVPGRRLYPLVNRVSAATPIQTVPLIQTEREVLTRRIKEYAEEQGIHKLPNPFMPLLPEAVNLQELRNTNNGWTGSGWLPANQWLNPLVGLVDDPANLQQPALRLNLAQGGHLAVYGNDGSETGSFLITLVMSLAYEAQPDRLHMYILDYEGLRLNGLRALPHLGDMISPDEPERAARLLAFLRRKLKERKECLVRSGCASFREFQEKSTEPVPDIVLILNNYTQFEALAPSCVEPLVHMLDQGAASYGIHLVVTGNRSLAISRRVSNLVQLAVTLRLSPDDDASLIVGHPIPGNALQSGITGRGLVRGNPPLEFQTAQVDAQEVIQQMGQAWAGEFPPETPVLKEVIPLSDLLAEEISGTDLPLTENLQVPIGTNTDTLGPAWLDLKTAPCFLVTGRVQGGKTTLIQTILIALAYRFEAAHVKFHFANLGLKNQRLYLLRNLPHTAAYADTEEGLSDVIQSLSAEIEARRDAFETAVRNASDFIDESKFINQFPALLLILDDYDQTFKKIQKSRLVPALESLIRQGNRLGLYVIMGLPSKEIQGDFASDPSFKAIREAQTGALLDRTDQQTIFSSQTPKMLPVPLPPGRGFVAHKGLYQPFQASLANGDGSTIGDWVDRITMRKSIDLKKRAIE
jgi:DNA segregation ATPase FtsK/SpoIIIE, S-DNA-T family